MEGLAAAFSPLSLLLMAVGVVLGMFVGAIPGFSATMGIAVLLPFTFALDPVPGLMLLLGLYGSALYSGAIPAILLRIPGTPGAAATVIDAGPMAARGEAGKALSISLVCSVIGGVIGVVLLAMLAPVMADFALSFGSAEYFMLAVFALAVIVSLSDGAVLKGALSALIGLSLAFIGLDPIQAYARYDFGMPQLLSGVSFIPVLIGLFGVAEALVQYERMHRGREKPATAGSFGLSGKEWRALAPATWWSSLSGFLVGVAPGAGGTVASFLAYDHTKRFAHDKSRFGKGDPRGVASAEAANNASIAGGIAPMLTLGVPGDAATALLIGALTVQGIQPGPRLFSSSPDLVYGLFVGLVVIYLLTLLAGLLGTRLWGSVLKVPPNIMWPVVIVLSVLGAYALRYNVFDIAVMVVAGVVGYLMLKGGIPVIPLVVGLVLGPIAESGLRRALIINDGSFSFVLQPVSLTLLVLTLVAIALPVVRAARARNAARQGKVARQPVDHS